MLSVRYGTTVEQVIDHACSFIPGDCCRCTIPILHLIQSLVLTPLSQSDPPLAHEHMHAARSRTGNEESSVTRPTEPASRPPRHVLHVGRKQDDRKEAPEHLVSRICAILVQRPLSEGPAFLGLGVRCCAYV